jgi:ribosomal protein S13
MTFLTAFPGVGISKANEQLRRFRVAPTATLGRLTARQVHEVEQFVWERLT